MPALLLLTLLGLFLAGQPAGAEAQVDTATGVGESTAAVASTAGVGRAGAGRSLAEYATGRVGAIVGTVHGAYAEGNFPGARVQLFNNTSDMVVALETGKVEVVLLDAISARAVLDAHPRLALLEEGFLAYPLGMGFRPDRDALRERFDRFLARIRADGRYAEIHRRWFTGDPARAPMPQFRAPAPRERYVVGVSIGDLPYVEFRDGRYVGFDVELLERFAAEEGIALELRALDFGALIPALAAGKLDIITDGIAITEERRRAVDFSVPYGEANSAALVLAADAGAAPGARVTAPTGKGWRGLDDLARGRLGVFTGTIWDQWVTHTYPQATAVHFKSEADLVVAVKTGKIDAALADDRSIELIVERNPELAVLERDFLNTPIAAAFRKDEAELRARFDRFLAAAQADGTLADMRRRWLEEDPQAAAMPEVAPAPPGRSLRVGSSDLVGLPFVTLRQGQPAGFDIELARRFGAGEGLRIEHVLLEFDGLLAALASGKIDMILSSLSVTEERRRAVEFSTPYTQERSAAMVLRRNLAGFEGPPPVTEAPAGLLESLRESVRANFLVEQRWRLIVAGLWTTVEISIGSTLFGTLVGALVCYLRMSHRRVPQLAGRAYIGLIRGVPVLLLLMLVFYVAFADVNIDPRLVAVLAFGLNFGAYVSEMFRSGIESVPPTQTEAGVAMGFTPVQTFAFIVLPQAARPILPVYRGEFISMVKMTSVVGYIGVQDLTKAADIIRSRTFEAFFPLLMVAALYFAVIWVLGLTLARLEHRFDRRRRRGRARPVRPA